MTEFRTQYVCTVLVMICYGRTYKIGCNCFFKDIRSAFKNELSIVYVDRTWLKCLETKVLTDCTAYISRLLQTRTQAHIQLYTTGGGGGGVRTVCR